MGVCAFTTLNPHMSGTQTDSGITGRRDGPIRVADIQYPVMRVVEAIHRAQYTAQTTTGEEQATAGAIVALLQVQLAGVEPVDDMVTLNEDVARELDKVLG